MRSLACGTRLLRLAAPACKWYTSSPQLSLFCRDCLLGIRARKLWTRTKTGDGLRLPGACWHRSSVPLTMPWWHVVGDRDFLGGKHPNRADLAVFGILRAVPTTDTFRATIQGDHILPWWTRMVEAVGESSRLEELPCE
jgi:hypothetical protein